MAYTKTKTETGSGWKAVKGLEGFTVIGSKDRFSVSCELEENFRIQINGCRVVEGKKGDFISYPAWKDKNGEYHNYAYITFSQENMKLIMEALD